MKKITCFTYTCMYKHLNNSKLISHKTFLLCMYINVSESGDYYGFGSLFIYEGRGGRHDFFFKSAATKNNYDAKI